MPLKGVHCTLGYVSMEDHERCMLNNPGPPCGVSPTILQMIVRPNQERIDSGVVFSPSSISSCLRQSALKQDNDWFLDVKQGYKMTRGTIVHKGLSQEPPPPGTLGVVRELRMKAEIDTKYGAQVFHGQADEVVLLRVKEYVQTDGAYPVRYRMHVKITDFKTRGEVGHDLIEPDRKHVYQVNQYAWLIQQFLPSYLNRCTGYGVQPGGEDIAGAGSAVFDLADCGEHLFLSTYNMPRVDEIVVDELSITYMDMVKPRTFTSKGFLYDQGKMLGDRINGHWVRRNPVEYDELELAPIHQFKPDYTERIIRKGIEDQIESETLLAPPVTGDDAKLMCRNCPVRGACYILGKREGYGMEDQEPYIDRSEDR